MNIFLCKICLVLLSTTKLVFSHYGNHFVAACPWLRPTRKCTVFLGTRERIIQVKITRFNERNADSEIQLIKVESQAMVSYILDINPPGVSVIRAVKPTSTFPVKVFQSAHPFRVTLFASSYYMEDEATIVNLIPKRLCHRSYYSITGVGYPFIIMFSFDFPETNIKLRFPAQDKYAYSSACDATDVCAPGKTVDVQMLTYKSWYYTVQSDIALINVHITSDRPIHLLTANMIGMCGPNQASQDQGIVSPTPATSWAKEYIVPFMVSDPLEFVFSTEDYPLKIVFHETVEGTMKTRDYTLTAAMTDSYHYGSTTNTLAVTANAPFAIYRLFFSRQRTDTVQISNFDILNIVPLGLWVSVIYILNIDFPDRYVVIHNMLVTQAPQDSLVIRPFDLDVEVKVKWRPSTIMVNNHTYSVADLEHNQKRITIQLANPKDRFINYLSIRSINYWIHAYSSFSYVFNIEDINNKDCVVSKDFSLSDHVDNDCDGFVDEEIKNGVDDDGDGLVDEDNQELYSDGRWTEWTHACQQKCSDTNVSVSVRLCENRTSEGLDCFGQSVQCDKKTCPHNCGNSEGNSTTCFCNAGCSSCPTSIFRCKGGCMSGYETTEHCLKRCPTGWTGLDCKVKKPENQRCNWCVVLLIILTWAIVVCSIVVYLIFRKKIYTEEVVVIEDEVFQSVEFDEEFDLDKFQKEEFEFDGSSNVDVINLNLVGVTKNNDREIESETRASKVD